MKTFLPAFILVLLCVSCSNTEYIDNKKIAKVNLENKTLESNNIKNKLPHNIIMVIGDGMGPAFTSAYRFYKDNPLTKKIEKTVFDRHIVGSATTYPDPISGYITDSGAAATALATGVKTFNDAVAVDIDKKDLQTVLEWAKLQGKKTSVVVTSQINHATPASYLAHNEYRKNFNAIANSYIDDGFKADVYLGGGWEYFIREDRNLVNEFINSGFHYIDKYQDLDNIPNNKPLLGLFDDIGLPWAADDTDKNRLATLTKSAVQHLENLQAHDNEPDNGFFMLVEGSQIDWAGHMRDVVSAMAEMDDLAKTIEYLETYVSSNPDTLVIITADHSTGGLALGKRTGYLNKKVQSKYVWQPDFIRNINMSSEGIAKKIAHKDLSVSDINSLLTFKITDEEFDSINVSKIEGKIIANNYRNLPIELQTIEYPPEDHSLILETLKEIIDNKTNTSWGSISKSGSHNALDVQVFAFGANSELFTGFQDNTDIGKKIFKLLGKQ